LTDFVEMSSNGSAPDILNLETSQSSARHISTIVFVIALLVGLYLRAIDLNGPPYENHAFRQTQTLSTIEDYSRHGIDLLHPNTIYMGYPGTFVLELPVFQALAALGYKAFGPQIAIVRLLNILFGAGCTWLLFLIVKNWLGRLTGMFAAMIYWLAPLNLIYHRSMLLDPSAVFCGLATFYLLEQITPRTNLNAPSENPPPSASWKWILFGLAAFFTAMIKALYLWPAVLLFFVKVASRRFRPDNALWKVFCIFGVSGLCFLAWNRYASSVNDTSIFTRGFKPTTLLGVSELFSSEFYREMFMHRSKRLLGGFGLIFYPIGLWAAWAERSRKEIARPLWLLALIPPSYLALFSNINRPHDYYQLIAAPFFAAAAGVGVVWVLRRLFLARPKSVTLERTAFVAAAFVLVASGAFTYRSWYKCPYYDPMIVKFDKLCTDKFEPQRPAMVFVSYDNSSCPPNSPVPEFVYAARLWGFGQTVKDAQQSRSLFEKYSSGFTNLEYLVFYGTDYPNWVPTNQFHPDYQDQQNRIFAFRQQPAK